MEGKLFKLKQEAYKPLNEIDERCELEQLVELVIENAVIDRGFILVALLINKVTGKSNGYLTYYTKLRGPLERKLVKELKFAERKGNMLFLNELGVQIKNHGGYKKYLKQQENKEEKEELELKQLRWFLKTKNYPYIFSAGALLVSLGALLISIFKD